MLLSQVSSVFKTRRQKLMDRYPGAAFLFPAAEEVLRNPDVNFQFRQESNFYYLSGFEEPEAWLLLANKKTYLFVRKRDLEREMWEGERYGTEGAMQVFGANEAFLIDDFSTKLPELLKSSEEVYYRLGLPHMEAQDRKVLQLLEGLRKSLGRSGKSMLPIKDPNQILGEMRLFKTPEEIEIQRLACTITSDAHRRIMETLRPGQNEYEVEALVDYEFRRKGCRRNGYGSIVGGGKNAACLHYTSNNEVLRDGEMLLIDAGGEYQYYTADITRTFPVGKTYTKGQAAAYDLVLKSQKAAIEMAKPGVTLPAIHRKVCEILIEGFLQLGLLKGKAEDLFSSNAFKRFYPHNTSHWLGIDVHDVGLYLINGEPRPLEAGMLFTIEPGFYVQPGDKEVAPEYKNIGIRIEDNILITASGNENLTQSCPKDREEIESIRAKAY